MPIVFRCEHCGQKLRVSSRKAGHCGKCPKCAQPFAVPPAVDRTSPPATPPPARPGSSVTPPPPPPEAPSSFDAIITDDETEILYDDQDFDALYESYGPVDHHKVAVSRKILIAQGVLLALVAVSGFTFGLLIGRGAGSSNRESDGMSTPCVVTGRVSYTTDSGQKFPDEGAVVYVLPQGEKPDLDDKIAAAGLRPTDAPPGDNHAGLQMIRLLGGAYARADASGEYRLRLPTSGKFWVLVVSRHGKRKPSAEISRTELAQMGRYFLPVTDLIVDRRYRWSAEDVYRDRRVNALLD